MSFPYCTNEISPVHFYTVDERMQLAHDLQTYLRGSCDAMDVKIGDTNEILFNRYVPRSFHQLTTDKNVRSYLITSIDRLLQYLEYRDSPFVMNIYLFGNFAFKVQTVYDGHNYTVRLYGSDNYMKTYWKADQRFTRTYSYQETINDLKLRKTCASVREFIYDDMSQDFITSLIGSRKYFSVSTTPTYTSNRLQAIAVYDTDSKLDQDQYVNLLGTMLSLDIFDMNVIVYIDDSKQISRIFNTHFNPQDSFKIVNFIERLHSYLNELHYGNTYSYRIECNVIMEGEPVKISISRDSDDPEKIGLYSTKTFDLLDQIDLETTFTDPVLGETTKIDRAFHYIKQRIIASNGVTSPFIDAMEVDHVDQGIGTVQSNEHSLDSGKVAVQTCSSERVENHVENKKTSDPITQITETLAETVGEVVVESITKTMVTDVSKRSYCIML